MPRADVQPGAGWGQASALAPASSEKQSTFLIAETGISAGVYHNRRLLLRRALRLTETSRTTTSSIRPPCLLIVWSVAQLDDPGECSQTTLSRPRDFEHNRPSRRIDGRRDLS